jgi:putative salt-induced outer membrane protein YdiY
MQHLERRIRICLFICCFLVVQTGIAAAQQGNSTVDGDTQSGGESTQPQPWAPPVPPSDKFDWIQLTSGEWLKGELKVLYEEKLEFDSDELGLLKLDWEDVKQVRSRRVFSIRLEGPITVKGLLQVAEQKVIVTAGDERQEFARSQLVAIAPGAPREIDYWSAKISIGFNLTRGNTEQTQWTTAANVKRRTSATRLVADWLASFSETDGEETVNNQRLSAFFDVFRTRKYFFRPVFGEYFRDPFSNISSRVTVGAGMGFHIIDTAKTEWDVSGGPAYQRTRFDSVPAGQDSSETTPSLVAGTHYNTELTETVDFDFLYSLQIVNEQSGTYTHHMVATFDTELTGWLDFSVSAVWDRIEDPQPDADGIVPKQNDYLFIIALGIDI